MNYIDIRDFIQSGDVVAFTNMRWDSLSHIESQVVRMFTRSEYSHVGIVWKINDRVFLLESVIPTIRLIPLSNFDEFYLIPIGKPLSTEAEEFAFSKIGQQYSKLEAIKGYLGINKDNSKWQCAEYVKAVLRSNGITLRGKATPTDVVRNLMELGSKIVLVKNSSGR